MDFPTLVELYGLPGLVIAGLAWGLRQERSDRIRAENARDSQVEARIADQKEHTSQIIENTRTLDRALELARRQGDV